MRHPLECQPRVILYGPSCIAFGAFSSSFFMASSSHRAATKAQPFSCHLLTPLIKLSLSSKSLFEQTSAALEGKEGVNSLLQACRVAKSPAMCSLCSSLLRLCGCTTLSFQTSLSGMAQGAGKDVWVILLIRRQPLMSPSLLPCFSKREGRNL